MNTRKYFHATLLGCIAFTLTSGIATVASADDDLTPHSIKVRYDDLNITNEAGAQKLYSRIRSAAKTVCGSRLVTRPVTANSAARKCEEEAIADAVSKVNSRVLTALHNQKAPRRFG